MNCTPVRVNKNVRVEAVKLTQLWRTDLQGPEVDVVEVGLVDFQFEGGEGLENGGVIVSLPVFTEIRTCRQGKKKEFVAAFITYVNSFVPLDFLPVLNHS